MDAEIQKKILKKAGLFLARRAHSRGELKQKLMKLAPEPEVESALDRLEQLNLLNDTEYAYNFALCRMKQDGWGWVKIHESLLRRQIPESAVQSAIERAWSELDEESALSEYLKRRFLKKRLPEDPKVLRKLVVHLRGRGFDEGNISRVLKRMFSAELMQHLDTGE
jgi:SOS response regulatory protein OraA/RecX